jgi:hypothetical protein
LTKKNAKLFRLEMIAILVLTAETVFSVAQVPTAPRSKAEKEKSKHHHSSEVLIHSRPGVARQARLQDHAFPLCLTTYATLL